MWIRRRRNASSTRHTPSPLATPHAKHQPIEPYPTRQNAIPNPHSHSPPPGCGGARVAHRRAANAMEMPGEGGVLRGDDDAGSRCSGWGGKRLMPTRSLGLIHRNCDTALWSANTISLEGRRGDPRPCTTYLE
ncbi:hypothetical protein FA13DRAFT_884170 [Coprinellus micaceus]|uniref:Uncharacterized protein n=1 Tax=Coprinellus micaceus TaxID=71717 RepID=A0A4Y7S0Z5_COPMI|nr:hypothetical protein FA13DRAFT_884170 [Coprinellus micaceus]